MVVLIITKLQHRIAHVNTRIERTNNLQHQDYQEVLQYNINTTKSYYKYGKVKETCLNKLQ
jgi:hypothetical protein